jgi:hypothetical protein
MSPLLNQAFGLEIAAMRQAQFEAEARHGALVQMLKRARRADHALTARTAARPAELRPYPAARPADRRPNCPDGRPADRRPERPEPLRRPARPERPADRRPTVVARPAAACCAADLG